MALTQEDLAALGQLIDAKISSAAGAAAEERQAPQDRTSVVGKPDVDPEAGPLFWVHLADGEVVETRDSSSSHLDVDGKPVLIIGRYQKGE